MARVPVVGMFGAPGGVLLAESSLETAIKRVGENTGNILFQYACFKFVRNPIVSIQIDQIDIDYLREAIDVFFIPAANQLNPSWDLSSWADIVERLNKPVVIVGLGGQAAEIEETHAIKLRPGTVRFVKLIAERAKLIGVRGVWTQRLLHHYGVHNTIVTGCPSNFINPTISGEAIASRLETVKQRVSAEEPVRINYLFGTMEEFCRPYEKILYSVLSEPARRVIYQTNINLLAYAHTGDLSDRAKQYIEWEARIVAPEQPPFRHFELIREQGRFYFDAKAWIDDVARDDLSIGMRIHGAVAAIQGASLGVCVAFDSRTLELAETMGYPRIVAHEMKRIDNLRSLIDLIKFSPVEFNIRRERLRRALKTAIEQEGVLSTL